VAPAIVRITVGRLPNIAPIVPLGRESIGIGAGQGFGRAVGGVDIDAARART
jgi:hypothetical protein